MAPVRSAPAKFELVKLAPFKLALWKLAPLKFVFVKSAPCKFALLKFALARSELVNDCPAKSWPEKSCPPKAALTLSEDELPLEIYVVSPLWVITVPFTTALFLPEIVCTDSPPSVALLTILPFTVTDWLLSVCA